MSVLGDAVQALNEDIEIASFLPAANYVFILIASGDGSTLFFLLALASSVMGATLFNHLYFRASEGPEDQEELEDDDKFINGVVSENWASAIIAIPWGVLLVISMYFLFERFPKNWILPEVLFFISAGFILLYLTHYPLNYLVNYNR